MQLNLPAQCSEAAASVAASLDAISAFSVFAALKRLALLPLLLLPPLIFEQRNLSKVVGKCSDDECLEVISSSATSSSSSSFSFLSPSFLFLADLFVNTFKLSTGNKRSFCFLLAFVNKLSDDCNDVGDDLLADWEVAEEWLQLLLLLLWLLVLLLFKEWVLLETIWTNMASVQSRFEKKQGCNSFVY